MVLTCPGSFYHQALLAQCLPTVSFIVVWKKLESGGKNWNIKILKLKIFNYIISADIALIILWAASQWFIIYALYWICDMDIF